MENFIISVLFCLAVLIVCDMFAKNDSRICVSSETEMRLPTNDRLTREAVELSAGINATALAVKIRSPTFFQECSRFLSVLRLKGCRVNYP